MGMVISSVKIVTCKNFNDPQLTRRKAPCIKKDGIKKDAYAIELLEGPLRVSIT